MSARPHRLEPASAAAVPQRIGRYHVEGVLGEGSMGVVYRAVDPLLARPVAIKTIRQPLLAASPAGAAPAAERFRLEAQAAARLSHPGIVSVYEYAEGNAADGEAAYIAMEFVEGRPLLELSARGVRLPLPDVLSVMLQLLDALQHAHERGVCHRDIKPGNLIVTADGQLKIGDFGIARIDSSADTQQHTTMGSPGYMAPERYTGEPPDARIDVFSCGVLLYELLTGAPPFLGPSNAVMYQVLHVDPAAPSWAPVADAPPARFDAIVAKAIAKRAGDRYASAAALRDALLGIATAPIAPRLSPAAIALLQQQAAARPPALASGGCDADTLGRIAMLLAPQLGPVAKSVVQRAARESGNALALLARLARDSLPAAERAAFMTRATALLETHRPGSLPLLPVLGTTPLQSELVQRAERVLAFHIGPIAALIVRAAAAAATTREQFFVELAERAGAAVVDRDALLAELNRQPSRPQASSSSTG